jgi:DUF1680 family protein
MIYMCFRFGVFLFCALVFAFAHAHGYKCKSPDVGAVKVESGFWHSRIETNRLVTIKTNFEKCEATRIPNFRAAAERRWGSFQGVPFDDADVYKVIEGAAYSLAIHPDEKLKSYVDELVSVIAKAQEPDGYLYTARTLGHSPFARTGKMMGPTRWSNISHSHELYNLGHLYEAAVAYYKSTGERTLLDVAVKSADFLDRTFGFGGKLKIPPGHEEIELALCKLYKATGEERYLKLSKFFVDMRGVNSVAGEADIFTKEGYLKRSDDEKSLQYSQNHLPVVKQKEAVGHAVRAVYLYSAMTDLAALTGETKYSEAAEALWENVVGKKLYLSGSVGSRIEGEAFGDDYELPTFRGYLETCAAIGNALWNQRMFLLYGDGKYIDVLERIIYNGFLCGVSLKGDEFFYDNPLACYHSKPLRSKWFSCSCCPVNVVRFIPQIPSFVYATCGNEAYINLFIESSVHLKLECGNVELKQKTSYPWDGNVSVSVVPPKDNARFTLKVRVPGWCIGSPVPSDLYTQVVPGSPKDFNLRINGEKFSYKIEKGYAIIDRQWNMSDEVEISMNMPVRMIRADGKVAACSGRVAIERGPIVYCSEGFDNAERVLSKSILLDTDFEMSTCDILGNAYPTIKVKCMAVSKRDALGKVTVKPDVLNLIPYFAWGHRGANEMQVWHRENKRK